MIILENHLIMLMYVLRGHIKTIHKGKKFKCNSCGKSFTQAGNLRVHIKTVHECHSDFECDSCDKAHKCDSCENPSLKVVI